MVRSGSCSAIVLARAILKQLLHKLGRIWFQSKAQASGAASKSKPCRNRIGIALASEPGSCEPALCRAFVYCVSQAPSCRFPAQAEAMYVRPTDLQAALRALRGHPLCILAGGTDFYPQRVG